MSRNRGEGQSREFSGELPDHETFCQDIETNSYRVILEKQPNDFLTINNLAYKFSEKGQLEEALKLAERAVAIAPNNGMILDTYGWILFKQKKYLPAIDVLKKSASFLPDHPIIHFHLGSAYHEIGNDKLAKEHLLKSLSVSSDFKDAEQARELLRKYY
jgi:tetratricopeptide (TPR) repeat protein